MKYVVISVVAMVGGAGRVCAEIKHFCQHSEQSELCCPAQISHRLHLMALYLNIDNFVKPLALGGLNGI